MLQQAARDFLAREAPREAIVAQQRSETGFRQEVWAMAAELGWLGMLLPPGGGGRRGGAAGGGRCLRGGGGPRAAPGPVLPARRPRRAPRPRGRQRGAAPAPAAAGRVRGRSP